MENFGQELEKMVIAMDKISDRIYLMGKSDDKKTAYNLRCAILEMKEVLARAENLEQTLEV